MSRRLLLMVTCSLVIACGADTSVTTLDTSSNRPTAPDFSLELGEGGTFTLSEGEKPVYLVFWAEW